MFRMQPHLGPVFILTVLSGSALADSWVWEPAIGLDLAYDDNFSLDFRNEEEVSSERVVLEMNAKRISAASNFHGIAKVDFTAYQGDDESLDGTSNQVLYFTAGKRSSQRTQYGMTLNYKNDSLVREATIIEGTDPSEDPDGSSGDVIQEDLRRQRLVVRPWFTHDLSRLTDLRLEYTFRGVQHEDSEITTDLTDFTNQFAAVTIGRRLTPVDRIKGIVQYSQYDTDDDSAEFTTSAFRLGYERSFSETLNVDADIGVRSTEYTDNGESFTSEGSQMSLSATKTFGLTRYRLRASRELYPSSLGQVLQADEVVANVTRNITELMDFSLRSRAYENTLLSESEETNASIDNNRRFLSIEPKLTWRFARGWSAAASYRYRREKVANDPTPAESNSVVFSIKYTRLSPLANNDN